MLDTLTVSHGAVALGIGMLVGLERECSRLFTQSLGLFMR